MKATTAVMIRVILLASMRFLRPSYRRLLLELLNTEERQVQSVQSREHAVQLCLVVDPPLQGGLWRTYFGIRRRDRQPGQPIAPLRAQNALNYDAVGSGPAEPEGMLTFVARD